MNGFKHITVADRQCLADIAMQQYGSYDGIFLLFKDNADRLAGLHHAPIPGMKLLVRTEVPKIDNRNRAIAEWFAGKKQVVVCGTDQVPQAAPDLVTSYVNIGYVEVRPPSDIGTDYIGPSPALQAVIIASQLPVNQGG